VIKVEVNLETGVSNIAGALSGYFSFEAVSGYDSYTVNLVRSFQDASETRTMSNEGRVAAGSKYFRGDGDGGDPFEIVIDESDTVWVRENGVWSLDSEEGMGYLFEVVILPDWQHSLLYESFDTLTFTDWDLIDGVWYARYAASREFAAAMTGRWLLSDDGAVVAGDVWVSPQGYMRSYSVSVEKSDSGQVEETTWALSDLGSTSIDFPASKDAFQAETTTEAQSAISTLEQLLATEFWDPTVLLDGQPFRWRGQSQIDFIDLDLTDNFSYSDDGNTQEFWGSVGSGGIERGRGYAMDPDTRAGGEFVQFDGMSSKRFGTFSLDGVFSSDEDWFSLEFEARPRSVAFGSLSSGYLAYNGNESSQFEIVGVVEIDGVRVTHLRSVVSDGVALGSRIDATFDFWVTEGSPETRVVKLAYTANWQRDDYSNGVVVGQTNSERSFEVYDVGDDSILIESP